MKIAVLSVTRDRLDYTKHCFATLKENAGIKYDHYVHDQGSTDGTVAWLDEQWAVHQALYPQGTPDNIGINRAMNKLVKYVRNTDDYDVIVKYDNDCELLTPDTLHDICWIAHARNMILSPRIHGLRNPVPTLYATDRVDMTPMIGGIFMAIPAHIFDTFSYNENNPVWGGDDVQLCQHFGRCGYVRGYDANHYETTDGQHERYGWYFDRRVKEGGPA